MFLAKKILAALLLPPAGLLLIAFFGLWLIMRNRGATRRMIGFGLVALALTSLLALSLPAVGKRLLAPLETLPPISAEQLVNAQAIVVLGGGIYHLAPEYGGDTVKNDTLERVRYAARLVRLKKLPVLVTGGAPAGGVAEALAMREVLTQEFGVAVKWTESASLDTAENAHNSAALLKAAGINRIALVSHGWHLRRAIPLFEQEGLSVVGAPTVYSTPAANLFADWLPHDFRYSRIALHEHLGSLLAWLRQQF